MDPNQFAGRKGVGTEHMLVALVDRVLGLLDKPGMRAVIAASVDWASAFSRTDPTKTISKFISMGLRSSLVSVLIEFLEEREMIVKFNQEESKLFQLIGGGPQGSWSGQQCYLTASNDNADFVEQEDRFKYCDDLTVLELVMLGSILTEYNFMNHVASDIGLGQRFLPAQELVTQSNLDKISVWTENNLMLLNKSKTNYLIFSRAREDFASRLTVDSTHIDRKTETKLLGVWLEESGKWEKNTKEILKRAYSRVSMLTKLKYAGVRTEDLLHNYKQFVRVMLEYCSVVWHSSLTDQQSRSLERCQSVCLSVILGDNFISYEAALEMTGLEKLFDRRQSRCLSYGLKSVKHPENKRFFPENPNLNLTLEAREREPYIVNFARTKLYQQSAIPYIQRLLNKNAMQEKQREEEGGLRRDEDISLV